MSAVRKTHSMADWACAVGQVRWKEVILLGGLVLPVWDVLQKAFAVLGRASERRVHVVRILTTGASGDAVADFEQLRPELVASGLVCLQSASAMQAAWNYA